MFKKKQSAPKRQDAGSEQKRRAQMPGMFGMYGMDDHMSESAGDDTALEDELNQLLAGGGGGKKKPNPTKPKKQLMDWSDLDAQISASLKDDFDDDDLDSDDGDLEAELDGIVDKDRDSLVPEVPRRTQSPSPVSQPSNHLQLLEERKKNYDTAIANAQANGESSKARRYKRGLDTINGLLKKVKAGKPIDENEIPCQVATGKTSAPLAVPSSSTASEPAPQTAERPTPHATKPVPTPLVQQQPKTSESPQVMDELKNVMPSPETAEAKADPTIIEMLNDRQKQFKVAAINAKKSGNKADAMKYFKIIKQFDAVIAAAKEGKPIDLSQMPAPPEESSSQSAGQTSNVATQPVPSEPTVANQPAAKGAPAAPKTLLEGLTQRREKYQSSADQAKEAGNGSKSRRMTRIVKQYDDAIKMCKAGKPFNIAELPVPMGYPPLPGMNEKQQDISDVLQQAGKLERDDSPMPTPPVAVAAHAAAASNPAQRPAMSSNKLTTPKQPGRSPSPNHRSPSPAKHSAYQQQLDFLLNRQAGFKEAALAAKKRGDKEAAMDLLKKMKGFQPMIEQAQNGLKVDITKVPMPPIINEEDPTVPNDITFEILDGGRHHEDDAEIFKTLLDTLQEQVKKARAYSDQFTHSGDINGADKFDHLARESQRDFEFVKSLKRHGDPPPRYHYESKSFESVHIIPELNSGELQLIIVQLLDVDAKEAKPFVEWEMPFPHDSPIKGKTDEAKGHGVYKYNAPFTIPINRKSKGFQRAIKSKAIKLEVLQRGGFLRSDKSLGSAAIKLAALETSCEIRSVEPLKDGRAVVGRIEVKVRMRTPLISSESKTITEKWMVISHEQAPKRRPAQAAPTPTSKPRQQPSQSEKKSKICALM